MTHEFEVAQVVALSMKSAMAPFLKRISELETLIKEIEARPPARDGEPGLPGMNGKDADPLALLGAIDLSVAKAVALLPVPKDGTPGASVDPATVDAMVFSHVTKAMAAIPVPKDGRSVTVADVVPTIASEVAKAVAGLPVPKDGAPGAPVDPVSVDAMVAAHVKRAVADLPVPKDGHSPTVDDVAPLIVGEVQKHIAAIPPARDGVGFTGAMLTREGHLTLTRSDGTTQDVGAVVGPPGQKGADGLAGAPVAGLSPDVICASVDMLLRKELAALDAAAPPRMTKRIIRDARGKIERVIEEPVRG